MFRTLLAAAMAAALFVGTPAVAGEARVVPPISGVYPLKLSDAELLKYELPPRPGKDQGPEALDLWNRAMALYPNSTKEGRFEAIVDLDGRPARSQYGPSYQNSICSYVSPPACFGEAAATTTGNSISTATNFISFTVPYLVARQCPSSTSVSVWAGNQHAGGVWQAGVLFFAQFNASCQATSWAFTPFWESWPQNNPQPFPGVTAAPGNQIYVVVWNTSANTAKAMFSNLSTGQSTTVTYVAPYSLTNPSFHWASEAHGSPPKFGLLQVLGSASDQLGRVFKPGYYVNGDVRYWHMVGPPTWVVIQGVGPGYFTMNGS